MTTPITPAEHCGHLMPEWVTAPRSECVLRPGHAGSHADDRGARWWYYAEDIDWRQRAERAEAEIAACRRQQWPQLVAHLAAALANTYELTIDEVLTEAHAAIDAKQAASAATQTTDGQEQPDA